MSKLAHDPLWLEAQQLKAHFKIKVTPTEFGYLARRDGDDCGDCVHDRSEIEVVFAYASHYDLELPTPQDNAP